MAKNKPKKIGKNAPCPCGSGKVYKRCCMAGEAAAAVPAGVDAAMRDFIDSLRDSGELLKRLDWKDFDFGVDLFDPVVGDITELISGSAGKLPEEAIYLRQGLGMRRHATPEIRARLCEELERRVDGRPDRLAHAAIIGLEDLKIEPYRIGLIGSLYHRHVLERVVALQDLYDAEEKTQDPDLLQLAKKVAAEVETADIHRLADRLRPLGVDALRYLEYAVPEEVDEAVAPFVEILAAHPGLRAARLLEGLLFESMTPALDTHLYAAFSRMPDLAWPLLLYRVQDPEEPDWNRLSAYEMLVRARRWEVFTPLMREFQLDIMLKQPVTDIQLPDLARHLADLDDRRAVGTAVKMISRKEMRPAGINALRDAWASNSWWKEVDDALTALRRDGIVLVGKGEELKDLMREKLSGGSFSAMEGVQFHMNMLQEDWNRAFHEDLDWLRPADVHQPGPRETALMQQYGAFLQARMAVDGGNLEGQQAVDRLNRLQHDWMRTPLPELDGRPPLAVIFGERRSRSAHPSRDETYAADQLSEMYGYARAAWEDGDREVAIRELKTILAIDPAHPFARRLLARLSPPK